MARRAFDLNFIPKIEYERFYDSEVNVPRKSGGGKETYYYKRKNENGARFSNAIIRDAREGNTLYSHAMKLLGIRKDKTYRQFANHLKLKA